MQVLVVDCFTFLTSSLRIKRMCIPENLTAGITFEEEKDRVRDRERNRLREKNREYENERGRERLYNTQSRHTNYSR